MSGSVHRCRANTPDSLGKLQVFASAKEEAAARSDLFREIDRRRSRMGAPQSHLVAAAKISSTTYEAARAGKTVPSWDTLTKLRDGLVVLGAKLEFEW